MRDWKGERGTGPGQEVRKRVVVYYYYYFLFSFVRWVGEKEREEKNMYMDKTSVKKCVQSSRGLMVGPEREQRVSVTPTASVSR